LFGRWFLIAFCMHLLKGERLLIPMGKSMLFGYGKKLKQNQYCHGKGIYRREQLELTIPAKFKDLVETFLNKDLKIDAKVEGNRMIIEAKPIENTSENV
jgi:hypothetical protein